MIRGIKCVSKKIGIDKTIALTLLTRSVQASSGVISIFFIAKYLSVEEQGYYYTFASIIAIQVFFELGLSGIITQYAAHEFAHLKWSNEQILTGDEYYKSRLSSLLRFCVKCFGVIATILFFILIIVGFVFFRKFGNSSTVSWQTPWVILCFSTSLNLFIDPVLAFFDGIGKISDMSQVRLIQKLFNVFFLFLFFFFGFKLYSAALASLIAIAINYLQLSSSKRFNLLKTIWKQKNESVISYFKEIFPFQWRIALSWISGYFIFQLFNPVLFATEGVIIAGKMGMTLQVLTGISSLSMSWIITKVPLMSSLIAEKKYQKLDLIFDKTILQLSGINFFLILVFIVGVEVLKCFNIPLGQRFLNLLPLSLLCIVTLVNQFVFSWATYLRCHKQEPFLLNSVVMGILCCISIFFLGKYFGLMGMMLGYSCLIVFIGFPWAYFIFLTKKKEWHNG